MNIVICGGGSLGHVMAGVLGYNPNFEINILTGHPQLWNHNLTVTDIANKKYIATLHSITSNPADVIPKADVVLLCIPGYLIEATLQSLLPWLSSKTLVGSIVSSTGFFYFAHLLLKHNQPIFGFQRVPFIARVNQYGQSAILLGYKKELYVAFENANLSQVNYFINQWSHTLHTPIYLLDNYLEASLTNSNPILHPARLYGMWSNWNPLVFYNHHFFFYKEWDNFSSEILIQCDEEFQTIISQLHLKHPIPTLLEYYNVSDASSLTRKIQTIPAFQNIMAPMKYSEQGYYPNLNDRYFTEDIDFGMQFIKNQAVDSHVNTPMIDQILLWDNSIRKVNSNI